MDVNMPIFAFGNLVMDLSIATIAIISIKQSSYYSLDRSGPDFGDKPYHMDDKEWEGIQGSMHADFDEHIESLIDKWNISRYLKPLMCYLLFGVVLQLIGIFYDPLAFLITFIIDVAIC